MLYRYAKQLHNHDEITIKETGEIVEVISTDVYEKDVFVYAMTKDGYIKLNHRQIK